MVISTINLQYRKLSSDQSIDTGFIRILFEAIQGGGTMEGTWIYLSKCIRKQGMITVSDPCMTVYNKLVNVFLSTLDLDIWWSQFSTINLLFWF